MLCLSAAGLKCSLWHYRAQHAHWETKEMDRYHWSCSGVVLLLPGKQNLFVLIRDLKYSTASITCGLPKDLFRDQFYSHYIRYPFDIFSNTSSSVTVTQVTHSYTSHLKHELDYLATLHSCLSNLKNWIAANSLQLNSQKKGFYLCSRSNYRYSPLSTNVRSVAKHLRLKF